MNITKEDLKRFNNTNGNDICMNDNYNLSKGYCKYDIYRKLSFIKNTYFGMFSSNKKLTINILKRFPEEIILI